MRFIQSGDSSKRAFGTVDRSAAPPYNEAKQKENPIESKIKSLIRSVAGSATPFQYNSSPKKQKPVHTGFCFFVFRAFLLFLPSNCVNYAF
jgi:hypothetical protein